MRKYTYIDHGDVPPGEYFEDVVLFECEARHQFLKQTSCVGKPDTIRRYGTLERGSQ